LGRENRLPSSEEKARIGRSPKKRKKKCVDTERGRTLPIIPSRTLFGGGGWGEVTEYVFNKG